MEVHVDHDFGAERITMEQLIGREATGPSSATSSSSSARCSATSSSSTAPPPSYPSMAREEYAHCPPKVLTNNLRIEPAGDPNLSSFDFWRCKMYAQNSFSFWKVKNIIHALTAMNAPADLVLVQCPSDANHRAGYSPKEHKVWMCANHFWNPFEFRRVLTHELVHAFDFARAKIDVENQDHVACTEIRAWNLSGECDLWTQFIAFMGEDMTNRKQRCVKDFTLASMKENTEANVTDDQRQAAIERVFRKCYRDNWPFTTKAELDNRIRESPMLNV